VAARGQRRSPRARAGTPAAVAEPPAPSTRALVVALACTLALRVVASVLPGRWLWGGDLGRDLPPLAFALPLVACALLLWPVLARPVARALPGSPRGTIVLGFLLALLAAALVWRFPDVVQFTGDSGMRHGAFATTDNPRELVPQAMPGDLAMHWALPRWMEAHAHWPAERTDRAIGAALAILNGLAALALARALKLTGAAALAVMAIAGWTGALALFSGYAKSLVELAVIVLAAAAALASVANGGGGLFALGALAAVAIVLHRAGLLLLPAWIAAAVLTTRARGGRPGPALFLSALPIAGVLAWLGARLAGTLTGFDVQHHVTHLGSDPLTIAREAIGPARLLDDANLLLLLVPVLPLCFALLGRTPRETSRPASAAPLVAVALLLPAALLLVLRPQQGVYRDWDMFAMAGVALAAWLAIALGERLARPGAAAWLAVPIALAAIAPSVQWLAHQSDADRAPARAHDLLVGPPARSGDERATGFDRLGLFYFFRGDAARASEACSLSVAAAPNPRTLAEWGMAETMRSSYALAQSHYVRAAELNPGFTLAWKGVAASSSALGDRAHVEQAVSALRRLEPRGETVRDAELWLQQNSPAGVSR
jgi:hypothetical protein